MDPVHLYKRFRQDLFYSFQRHSTDLELDELGRRYSLFLEKHHDLLRDILTGDRSPNDLHRNIRSELESLAAAEAKFSNELPVNIQADHFEHETEFSDIAGKLRGLVEGQAHLARLVKPAEYDSNYWFYREGDDAPQNVFCSEFGLDLIAFLKAIRIDSAPKRANLRRAFAYRVGEVYQFWALAPYLHHTLMQRGTPWAQSLKTIFQIAGKRFEAEGSPFAGRTEFQLGYDERMPTHLIARMEAMRDIGCLQRGEYLKKYGIALFGE